MTPQDDKMIRHERLEMYQRYPRELTEEVARVVRPLVTEQDRILHNSALSRFVTFFDTDDKMQRLWRHMAQAVLDVANTDREEKE